MGENPKNLNVVIKYLGGVHNDVRKVILFEPNTVDEPCVQGQCIVSQKQKGKLIGLRQWEQHGDSNKAKKKRKGKNKKNATTAHACKEPNNHYDHCNIDGHTR